MLTIEEFLPIYADAKKDKDVGQIDDFVEVLRLYDKDGNGTIPSNQLTHLLMGYGNLIILSAVYRTKPISNFIVDTISNYINR